MTADMSPHLSGTPVLITLATGLMIAFAVQLLLTTFGIAAGITAIGYLPEGSPDDAPDSDRSSSRTIDKIGFAVGAGTLLTVNIVLFVACFLAVKLSLVNSAVLGAILGIVIWSGYFLILAWLGSSAVGSLFGSIARTLTAGVQGLTTIMTAVFGRKSDEQEMPDAIAQQFAATRTTLNAIQQELASVRQDSAAATEQVRSVPDAIQEYLQTLQPPRPDVQTIQAEFAAALRNSGLPELAQAGVLGALDRQTLIEVVSDHTEFSKQDIGQIVEHLESVWREVLQESNDITDLTHFLRSAPPEQLSAELNDRLNRLRMSTSVGQSTQLKQALSGVDLKQLGRRLMHTVMQRVDVSDLEVGKLLQPLQGIIRGTDSSESSEDTQTTPFNTIQADVEDFLLNAYPWHLTHKTVKVEFWDVLYDPDADPNAVRGQLLPLDRDYFESLLQQRDDLSPAKIRKVVDRLEEVRQEVLQRLDEAEVEEHFNTVCQQIAEDLQTAKKSALKPSRLQQQFTTLLRRSPVEFDRWTDCLQRLNRVALKQILSARGDLSQKEQEQLAEQIETVRDRLLSELHQQQARLPAEVAALWQQLEKYVRDPGEKLTARSIQRQIKALVRKSKLEMAALGAHLPKFDPEAVEQWLVDRQDLSEKRIRQVTDHLKKAWSQLKQRTPPLSQSLKVPVETATEQAIALNSRLPRRVAVRTQSKVRTLWDTLADYLHSADQDDLTLESIQRTLGQFLQDLPADLAQVSDFFSQVDRPSLIRLLTERNDLAPGDIEQIADGIEGILKQAIAQLQATQQRVQQAVESLLSTFRQTLASLPLPDIDEDHLKLDLYTLLGVPQAGLDLLGGSLGETLRQQLSEFNRDTLAKILQTRDDLSSALAHQLLDRVDAVRSGILLQIDSLQQQTQEQLDALKQQTLQRATETRRAIAIAAWWLFGTALTSMTTSAIAGALAVRGLAGLL